MRNFVLGIAVCLCFGAATVKSEILTVKPAIPKSIRIKEFSEYRECTDFILKNTKEGFITKSISSVESKYNIIGGIIIMEKY